MPAAASSSDDEPSYTRPLYNKRSAALKQPGTWPSPRTPDGRDTALGQETRQFRAVRGDDEEESPASPGDSWISGRNAGRSGSGQAPAPEKRSAAAQAEAAVADPTAEEEAKAAPVKRRKRTLLRLSWWIVRKSIVPILFVVSLIAGLYIGYTMVGDGPKGDVWEWSTWKHMYDLVFSEG